MIESQLQALNVVHDADLKGKRVITTIAIRKGELVAQISGHREVSAPSRFTVQAGVDLALVGRRAAWGIAAHRTLSAALRDGRLSRSQARAGAARVLALRSRLGRAQP